LFGIGATIRMGQKMLCLPYAGFFSGEQGEKIGPQAPKGAKGGKICPNYEIG
jgi:hypothetical protein